MHVCHLKTKPQMYMQESIWPSTDTDGKFMKPKILQKLKKRLSAFLNVYQGFRRNFEYSYFCLLYPRENMYIIPNWKHSRYEDKRWNSYKWPFFHLFCKK